MEEVKIDKRTKEYKESLQGTNLSLNVSTVSASALDYEKAENNPGWKLCMYCGKELPPNEDGTVKFRRFPEACYDCVWRNK